MERLLRRHGIIEKKRRGGLAAAEVEQLKELYDRWAVVLGLLVLGGAG